MHREFDRPPRRWPWPWPWPAVMVAGGIVGALEAFGMIGVTSVSDPTVDQPIVTQTDWWPPDSALLGLVACIAIPIGLFLGAVVAAGLPIATLVGAPPIALPFATTAAVVSGAVLSVAALRSLERAPA